MTDVKMVATHGQASVDIITGTIRPSLYFNVSCLAFLRLSCSGTIFIYPVKKCHSECFRKAEWPKAGQDFQGKEDAGNKEGGFTARRGGSMTCRV